VVARLRPPQTAACHVSRQQRQTRNATAAGARLLLLPPQVLLHATTAGAAV